ncbi:MAG: hypothetical protein AAGB93_19950 [Planctomycetota bacterium]
MLRPLALLLAALAVTACSVTHSRVGDDNRWRGEGHFERGVTTMGDVLEELGPPAQVYDFREKVAFFYLLVEERRRGYDLKVFKNTYREYLTDRVLYVFDREGILEEFGFSRVQLPRESVYIEDPWSLPDVDGAVVEASEAIE